MRLTDREPTDDRAAQTTGWSKERVSGARKVYVDQSRLVMALAQRVAAKQAAQ